MSRLEEKKRCVSGNMIQKIRAGRRIESTWNELLIVGHQDDSLILTATRNIMKLFNILVKNQFSEVRQLFRRGSLTNNLLKSRKM